MQLRMQTINGTADVLPINEDNLVTGPMGDCVSAIVLAKKNSKKNKYEIVRGYHGLGGAENINFDSLLNGLVYNDTILYIFRGTLQRTEYAKHRIQEIVNENTQHQTIISVQYFDYSNASVNRLSEIIPISY